MAIRLQRSRERRRECLNVGEAANFLGVSVPFLYKWLDKIPHRKLGNRVLFGRVALIKWLDGRGRYDLLAGKESESVQANGNRRPQRQFDEDSK